jgi:hypothetical protein
VSPENSGPACGKCNRGEDHHRQFCLRESHGIRRCPRQLNRPGGGGSGNTAPSDGKKPRRSDSCVQQRHPHGRNSNFLRESAREPAERATPRRMSRAWRRRRAQARRVTIVPQGCQDTTLFLFPVYSAIIRKFCPWGGLGEVQPARGLPVDPSTTEIHDLPVAGHSLTYRSAFAAGRGSEPNRADR